MQNTLEHLRALAQSGDYRRIPIKRDLLADFITPIEALRVLRAASTHCFLLESAEAEERWGALHLSWSETLAGILLLGRCCSNS